MLGSLGGEPPALMKNEGNGFVVGVGGHGITDGSAISDGHHEVAQHQVGVYGFERSEAFFAIVSDMYLVAFVFQDGAQDIGDNPLIFDYQDGFQYIVNPNKHSSP